MSDPIQQMRDQATMREAAIVAEIQRIRAQEYSDLGQLATDEDNESRSWPLAQANDQMFRVQRAVYWQQKKQAVTAAAEAKIQALNNERDKLPTGHTG